LRSSQYRFVCERSQRQQAPSVGTAGALDILEQESAAADIRRSIWGERYKSVMIGEHCRAVYARNLS
jgi:hypothetical protein